MNKVLKFIIPLIIIILIVIIYISSNSSQYPSDGKDMTESFGNGRFAIIDGSGSDYPGGPKIVRWYLRDYKTDNVINDNLVAYYDKKPNAYIIGDSYIVINYKTEEYQIYKVYDDIPEKEKEIFKKLEKRKIGRHLRDYVMNY